MLKRSPLARSLALSLFAVAGLAALSYYPVAKIRAAGSAAKVLPSAGKPLVNLKTPQTGAFTYAGDAAAVAALNGGTANATALAAADFDADGAMDVVAGYATGGNGGVLVLFHGNPDAFAPKDQSLYTKAMQGKIPPTFLPTASAFSLPESPDILLTGDFNRDGKKDVLIAARGGSLYLLLGDGHGSLAPPQPVALADQVTSVAVTPDGHAAVSTDGRSGPQVTILAPGAAGLTAMQTDSLPARGESAAWGGLGGGMDLAVGAGSNIVLIYGALRPNPQAETVKLPFQVKAVALGDFISDHDGRTEIAALASDGSIQILQHGTLKKGPYSAAETAARRALRGHHTAPAIAPNPTALGPWTVAKQLPYAGSAPAVALPASGFSTTRLASSSTQDLMVVDAARSQLHILDTSGKTASPSADVAFSGTPVAALALPQSIDSGRDIVALTSNQAAPTLIHAVPELTLSVNNSMDQDNVGACTNSGYTSIPSSLSLREAVCIANNSAPNSTTINVPSGIYQLSLNTNGETGELEIGNASNGYSLSIMGAGSSSTIIQQTDGIDRVMEQDVDLIGGNPLSLSGLTLTGGNCTDSNNSQSPPGDCGYGGGGAIIAGTFPNDDLTLTNVVMSGNSADDPGGEDQGGGLAFGGPNLTITSSSFTNNLVYIGGGGVQFQDGQGAGGDGSLSITNSTFSGNTAAADNDGGTGGGLYVYVTTGYSATITGSTFTGNKVETGPGPGGGIYAGGESASNQITVSNSRIVGNTTASNTGNGVDVAGAPGNLENNWWGCNAGPGNSSCDTVSLNAGGSYTPVLTLSISASPTQVATNGSTTLTAKLNDNGTCTGYSGNACYVPDGTPVSFSGGSLGTANPSSTSFSSGSASSTFSAGNSTGTASVSATVDNQTVSTNISIGAPPTITSGNAATFTVGTNGSFTVTTSGSPAASVSESGSLPSGVSFVNNGNGTATISGTPNPGTGGQYGFTITAQNGYSPNAMQSFTLTVDQAPSINSSNHTTFGFGSFGTFTVTTAAGTYPSATTFSESGSLPNGVNFSNSGVLSGTPTQAGSFPITITAANGISPNATQSFTLSVIQGSTSISVNTVSPSSEAYGQDGTVTITAVLSWTGTGPAPSASNVVIEGNGQTGSYSATSCGAPVSDTMTCSATYTPSGADTVGTYTENAEFVGDSNYGGSGSSQTNNFSITQATSSTSVGSSVNPSIVGQQVTFTATIDGQYGLVVKRNGVVIAGGLNQKGASGLAHAASTQKGQAHPADTGFGGTVTWSSNTGCSPSSVSGDPGTAQCVTSTLQQGTDTIMATYSGDTNHSGSSANLSGGQVVNPAVAPTSIAVTGVSASSEAYGQDAQITITAVLSWTGNGPTPTASDVTIGGNGPGGYGATSCGSPSGDSLTCQATYTPTAADTVGSYTETASFSGDSNYTGSSSSQSNNFSITQATSSTSVGSSQNPSIVGQPVTFTATIDGQYGLVVKRNGAVISGGISKQGASRLTKSRPSALKPVPSSNIGGTVTWSSNTGCSPSPVSGDPGTAQCVTSTLGQGTDTITATYSGDTNYSGSSATLSGGQVVNPAVTPTSIAVTGVSPSSEAYGQDATVTITAVLSWTGNGPAPTASDVSIGGNGPSGGYSGTSCGSPNGDTITCQAAYTPTAADTVGSYTETASFSGDSNYTGSSSSQTNNFSITQATSGTTVASGQNPSILGQPVTFTATIDGQYGLVVKRNGVLPGGATRNRGRGLNQKPLNAASLGGTVSWSSNTGCSPSSVSGDPGIAQCVTSTLPQGVDTITATYSGDGDHSGSTGTLSGGQQVNSAPAITSANNTTFTLNSANTFPVTTTGYPAPSLSESGPLPNGVTFVDNHNGTGTLSGTPTVGGTFPITFTASNGVGSAAMQNFTLTVTGSKTTTTLVSDRNPADTGRLVVFTATVTSAAGTPTGTVKFLNGATVLGSANLVRGKASVYLYTLPYGTDVITATYEGNSSYNGSTSAPLDEVVYETTTTAMQSSSNPSAYDQMVTFTATVSSAAGAPPDGEMITFQSGKIFLGSAPLSGGKASVTTSVLPRETDRVVATYAGDSNFASSTGTVVQVVNKASTNTSLLSSPNPSNYHQAVVFTVSVTTEYGGTAVGTVTLMDGSKNLGMFPLNNGTVSVTISNLSVGTHNITATFEGDNFYASSTSSPVMQKVN
jgi:hypothetical protein